MYFGSNLRYLRRKASMQQSDIAEMIGRKNYTTIQHWEIGHTEPTLKIASQLAEFFHVSLDDMVNKDLAAEEYAFPEKPMAPLTEDERTVVDWLRALDDPMQKAFAANCRTLQQSADKRGK